MNDVQRKKRLINSSPHLEIALELYSAKSQAVPKSVLVEHKSLDKGANVVPQMTCKFQDLVNWSLSANETLFSCFKHFICSLSQIHRSSLIFRNRPLLYFYIDLL